MSNLKGVGVALVTPFNEDLSIDFDSLTKLIEYNIENGTNFLVVLGTTAEAATLSSEEKKQVINHIIKVNNKRVPLVLGIGGNNTLEVKKQIEIGDMLEEIKISTINANDNVKEYANQIIAHLEKLQEDQNLFERKNYMVISSFNNRKVAESELKEFYQLLRYHLLNIKVSTRLLNDREIVELIYEQLHKGNKNKVADIEQKGGFELYVTDKTRKKD